MTFTRRTYRVAIARSISKELEIRQSYAWRESAGQVALMAFVEYRQQITHTARLQRRKRRERK